MELHGLLVLDKPSGITSRDAVNRIQRQLPRRTRVGHTGTLDPLATGVLVICLGHATRLAEYVQAMPKTYCSTFLLGSTSDTDDADGSITPAPDSRPLPRPIIESALASFVGEIEQTPPAFSAAKVAGQRAYDLAREGGAVELRPRLVTVYRISIRSYVWPNLDIEVHCGKGTYIRSLARDLGRKLGCGALVSVLRRTAVGPFTPELATPLDASFETIRARMRPMSDAVAAISPVIVSEDEAQRLRQGQSIHREGFDLSAVYLPTGELVGIAEHCDGKLQPLKMIPVSSQ